MFSGMFFGTEPQELNAVRTTAEIIKNKVKNITGYDSNIIRFPGGSSNTISRFNNGIMTRLVKMVKENT